MSNYVDNSVPYGSRVLTVSRLGVSQGDYVAEQISLSRPANVIKRYDQVRNPNGAVGQEDFVTGSATLQLATSSSKQLRVGDTFPATFDDITGSETFWLTSVDQPESQGDYKKQSVQFQKKYG